MADKLVPKNIPFSPKLWRRVKESAKQRGEFIAKRVADLLTAGFEFEADKEKKHEQK